MSLGDMQRRLSRLEHGAGDGGALLEFEDGGTLSIAPRDALALACDAMRRQNARDEGEPLPASRYGRMLDGLERATNIKSDDPLLLIIHSIARPATAEGVSDGK